MLLLQVSYKICMKEIMNQGKVKPLVYLVLQVTHYCIQIPFFFLTFIKHYCIKFKIAISAFRYYCKHKRIV